MAGNGEVQRLSKPDPYAVLGIARDATPEEIRTAFRRLIRQRHPDTSTAGEGGGLDAIIDAYHLLIDPARRSDYDAGQRAPRRTGAVDIHAGRERSSPRRARPCPECAGAGIVRRSATCPACRGHAEVTSLEYGPARILRCQTCRGSGHVTTPSPCPACSGRGVR